jgi:hypothetical protein
VTSNGQLLFSVDEEKSIKKGERAGAGLSNKMSKLSIKLLSLSLPLLAYFINFYYQTIGTKARG